MSPNDIALCKYHIEAEDNIGYLRVLNPRIALLHAITTSYLEYEFRFFLQSIAHVIPITFLHSPMISR